MEPIDEQGIENHRNERIDVHPPHGEGPGVAGRVRRAQPRVRIMTNHHHHQPTTGEGQSAEQLDLSPSLRTELARWNGRL
jgi:hypothetical protein